jgi:tetrahydromethanopterin S-methyltransferase subunit G
MTDDTQKILQAMALGFKDVNARLDVLEKRVDGIQGDIGIIQEDIGIIKQDVRVLKDESQHTSARLTRVEEKLELPPLQKKFG